MGTLHLIGLTGIAENTKGDRVGSARVGKDFIAKWLNENHGYLTSSFAEPMYMVVNEVYKIPWNILRDPTEQQKDVDIYQPWGKTLRELLQDTGSAFRELDPEVWVKRAEIWLMDGLTSLNSKRLLSDVRYENEADMIRRKGGTIIHVHRQFENYAPPRKHSSETQVEVKSDDLHIYNYGSKEDLQQQVNHLIHSII